jgi:hypothetical protein
VNRPRASRSSSGRTIEVRAIGSSRVLGLVGSAVGGRFRPLPADKRDHGRGGSRPAQPSPAQVRSTIRDHPAPAVDELLDQVDGTSTLAQPIACIPVPVQPERPVGAGLHLLTGHVGKGQEFDLVIVVGLEDGKIPFFLAKTPDTIAEERRVLHVMLSRAKSSLIITRVDVETRTADWKAAATPSPWWDGLSPAVTHDID